MKPSTSFGIRQFKRRYEPVKSMLFYSSLLMLFLCTTMKLTAQSDVEIKAWMEYMTPGDMHKVLAVRRGMDN